MKQLVFSVHDSKAEAFLQPFFVLASGQAIRHFQDAVNDPGHDFSKHPEDYTLFHVGEFDPASGELVPVVPKTFGNGLQYRGE